MFKRVFITGGGGFIGSNLADYLLAGGAEVVVYDNFSTGRKEFLADFAQNPKGEIVEADLLDCDRLAESMRGCDAVFHLAANADVRDGLKHPRRDLQQNTIVTSNVLEAMRANNIKRILFSSTGSVYGEPKVFPTSENCPFPVQTSLYGASKLAGEGLIAAYCHGYGFTGVICRFVSILGERYSHGHVYDFYAALKNDPTTLHILGNGKQEKSYLYVQDCIAGMLTAMSAHTEPGEVETYNLGTNETIVVNGSVEIITQYMQLTPELSYAGGERGWAGDSPLILLDCQKLRALGWQPQLSIKNAIQRTLAWLDSNSFIFEERKNERNLNPSSA